MASPARVCYAWAMALALMKLYNALKNAGVPDAEATDAAAEVAEYENRLSTVERHLEVLQTKTNIVLVLLGGIALRLIFL